MPFARAVLAVLVVAIFASLIPTAYADPPDPTWVSGYWDDDDLDDIVVFLTLTTALREHCTVRAEPLWTVIERVEVLDALEYRAPCPVAEFARAPPVVPLSSR